MDTFSFNNIKSLLLTGFLLTVASLVCIILIQFNTNEHKYNNVNIRLWISEIVIRLIVLSLVIPILVSIKLKSTDFTKHRYIRLSSGLDVYANIKDFVGKKLSDYQIQLLKVLFLFGIFNIILDLIFKTLKPMFKLKDNKLAVLYNVCFFLLTGLLYHLNLTDEYINHTFILVNATSTILNVHSIFYDYNQNVNSTKIKCYLANLFIIISFVISK